MAVTPRPGFPGSVTFFTPTLGRGGAEMQMLRLANGFAERGYRVSVLCIRPGGEYETLLSSACRLVHLTSRFQSTTLAGLAAKQPLIRHLCAEAPDVIVAVLNQTCALLGDVVDLLPRRPLLVLGVQNNMQAQLAHTPWWLRVWLQKKLSRAFPKAGCLVSLSRGAAATLGSVFPQTRAKTRVIYNAGFDDTVLANLRQRALAPPSTRPLIVACGRLHPQKDYPTLLRTVARIRTAFPAVRLQIIGSGPERAALERMTRTLGLADKVDFLGFQANPHQFIAQADVFVLSSRWEGFANVLVEAMVCRTPVVATDCPYGPREIIVPYVSGILAPIGDEVALADAVCTVLTEPRLADRLRQGGWARAQQFSAQASVEGYEQTVRELIHAAAKPTETT